MENTKNKSYLILLLLIVGLIIGPIYSVVSFYNLSKSQSTYGKEYDTTAKNSNFLPLTKRIFGTILSGPIAIHNSTVYALDAPNQFMENGSYDNYSNNGTYELLEINFTSNFKSIETIKTYNISSIPLKTNFYYKGLYFYKKQFWTYSSSFGENLLSFSNQGSILTNNTFPQPNFSNTTFLAIRGYPLGIYKNLFWRQEIGYEKINNQDTEVFDNITAYSLNTFTRNFSRTISNYNSLYGGFINENNNLWLKFNNQNREAYYEFSMNEIMNSSKLTIKKAILENNPIQSIPYDGNYNLTSYNWSATNVYPTAVTIQNNKIIQIDTSTLYRVSFSADSPFISSLVDDSGPNYILGVDINNPVVYHIGTLEIATFLFGYVLTGVMSVVVYAIRKKEKY